MSAAAAKELPTEPPAVIVFGRDETGKPHASCFGESEAALARKAASMMIMTVLPVTTETEALAAKVPRGRVFASGRAFVPFIKAALYTELQAAALQAGGQPVLETENSRAREFMEDPGPELKQPADWGGIETGSIVLATGTPRATEWFECVVLAANGDDLTLRFCDWPAEPSFTRAKADVALLHPTYRPEPPLQAAE